MVGKAFAIGIVAPAAKVDAELMAPVIALADRLYPGVRLRIHPQCYRSHGHFAGTDEARLTAFVETANDPELDAVWFARGGYGACRIAEAAIPRLNAAARRKIYLGYSDMGFLLAGLYRAGFAVAHGPMPADILREGGETAVARALRFLVEGAADTQEPSLNGPTAAFNMTVLSALLGTALEPDLRGHVLMLEDVSEYMYRIDRTLFHILAQPAMRDLAGIRLGRVSDVPDNDPPFGEDETVIVRRWCERFAIPYLGRADIGHDAANKVVPFGWPFGRPSDRT